MYNTGFHVTRLFPQIKNKINNIDLLQLENSKLYSINPIAFLKEFGSIRINFGRQSGHTTLALKMMREYDDAILYVFKSSMISSKYYNRTRTYKINNTNNRRNTAGCNKKIVIIDMASMVSKSFIYNIFLEQPKFVLLLG